jgi:3-oxoacyl-[acyl-carrier-protein] synthase-3
MTIAEHAELCIAIPGEQGNGIAMYTKAREIHDAAIDMISPLLDRALTKCGKKFTDFDYYLPHQTSVRAMQSGARRVGRYFNEEYEKVGDTARVANVFLLLNVPQYGNTASTTHFVAMHRFLKENKFKKGTRIIFAAHASGLVLGYVLATIGDMEGSHGHGD